MVAPNPLYIPLFTLEEVILDKDTGLPLSGGVVRFFRDEQRVQPKAVYQISGSSPIYSFTNVGAVFTLSISGTFVDGNGDPFVPYAYPYDIEGDEDLYYVTVESEGGVSQFTRQAVPYIASGGVEPEERSNTQNELSNPQFVEVLFDTTAASYTYDVTGSNTVTAVAPDWDVISSGTGTIEVSRLEPTSLASPTNPPYALQIQGSSGLGSSITLRQRLSNSPRLLSSDYVSGSFVAGVVSGGDAAVSMTYVPSTGTATTIIPNSAVSTDGEFEILAGNVSITPENTDPASIGYVDINIIIPTQRTLKISSVQIVGLGYAANIPFDQEATARQIDHLFHYYKPLLTQKPIPSALVAWDFPLNPAQFTGDTVAASAIGPNKSKYVWDQTIIFQSANSGVGVTRGPAGELLLTAAVDTQAAIVQYLPQDQARKLLNGELSVNVAAKASTEVNATVSLWYTTDASLPNVASGTNNSIVATLGTNGGVATQNGTWTEVPRTNLGDALFAIETNATSSCNDYAFSGWDLNGDAAANTATWFAIVVGTAQITAAETVGFYSVSLCPGGIATRPAPQTYDQVLQECEYYYEKSYAALSYANEVTAVNQLQRRALIDGISVRPMSFSFSYHTIKRVTAPTLTLYSPTGGGAGLVLVKKFSGATISGQGNAAISNWTKQTPGAKAQSYNPTLNVIQSGGSSTDANIFFHYVCDARLGII